MRFIKGTVSPTYKPLRGSPQKGYRKKVSFFYQLLQIINIKMLMIFFFVFSLFCFGQEEEVEKVREKVEVANIEVPVRVFFKGEPVAGLKKEDFKLLINGKEHQVNAFYQVRKKIRVKQPEQNLPPRLFVLLFNVSDYHPYLLENIDLFFEKIIRPHDRLIVVSNNFFLNDKTIFDVEEEKKRIKKILEIEARRIKLELFHLRNRLRSLLEDKDDRSEEEILNNRFFVQDYIQYIKGFKKNYLGMQADQYIKIARYLKGQRIEKWVFNFFQLGMFFYPDFLEKLIEGAGQGSDFPGLRTSEMMELYMEAYKELQEAEKSSVEDISKFFINAGATFHTQLMKSRSQYFLEGYRYKPITLKSENIFLKATEMSGGIIANTNKIKTFLNKVTSTEDIYYMLTYDPGNSEDKNRKIEISVADKRYRVIYDDQERSRYLLAITKKAAKEDRQILLENLHFEDGVLSFSIANIKLIPAGELKTGSGKVLLKIKILDAKSNILFGREKKIELETQKKEFKIGNFPPMQKGNYDIIVEVYDLNTGKNDLSIKEIRIKKQKQG